MVVVLFSTGSGHGRKLWVQVGSFEHSLLMPCSQERSERFVWLTRTESPIPNRAISRQTMVKRRASIGISFDGEENARTRLNDL
jgi:hypothetical protein